MQALKYQENPFGANYFISLLIFRTLQTIS